MTLAPASAAAALILLAAATPAASAEGDPREQLVWGDYELVFAATRGTINCGFDLLRLPFYSIPGGTSPTTIDALERMESSQRDDVERLVRGWLDSYAREAARAYASTLRTEAETHERGAKYSIALTEWAKCLITHEAAWVAHKFVWENEPVACYTYSADAETWCGRTNLECNLGRPLAVWSAANTWGTRTVATLWLSVPEPPPLACVPPGNLNCASIEALAACFPPAPSLTPPLP